MDKLLDIYLILTTMKEYNEFIGYCKNKNINIQIGLGYPPYLSDKDYIRIVFKRLRQSTLIYPSSDIMEIGSSYRSIQKFTPNMKKITLEEFRYV